MTEHYSEHDPQSAFTFNLRQPDGREVAIDMSVTGSHDDFAFTATVGETHDLFFAYWMWESSIFLDAMMRLRSHPHDKLVEDITLIRSTLANMETSGYTPSEESRDKIDKLTVSQKLAEPLGPRQYSMFSRGDDTLLIDTLADDGLHIASERDMDGEQVRRELVIPDRDIWRFVAGMIARSYSSNDGAPMRLSRFSTKQYMDALNMCLTDTAG